MGRPTNVLLAGDVGATKTVLGLFDCWGDRLVSLSEAIFASTDYASLETVVAAFLDGQEERRPEVACFGVPGPVSEGRCEITNLPWVLSERELAAATGVSAVRLLNDVQAMALGMAYRLGEDDWVELNPGAGRPRSGNVAVIAAGTGLGEAILYWDGERYHALPTEGGHSDFAPNGPLEEGLLAFLRDRFCGHVSYERILSGSGLANLYDYLRHAGVAPESEALHAALASAPDRAPIIAEWALERRDALCTAVLDLFAAIYGAEAGNLALKSLALGGVILGGGIAPKILPVLQAGRFMAAFTAKGRLSPLLGRLPVRVAIHPQPALLGAAHAASAML
ncbi:MULTISPECIES: glucokinase [Methylococcus]|uniref:Glucokinase n=1 Tax=Methylococcus capsulatus TaxID=414 RepID=A0AA35XSX2_METCP|nr:glucokinase [Methylococcus capsulatus]UQN10897.1 glucokinase [Methylococcus capsulatus]CAI8758816.1 Glucokinase [Methylococcus capsulatus]